MSARGPHRTFANFSSLLPDHQDVLVLDGLFTEAQLPPLAKAEARVVRDGVLVALPVLAEHFLGPAQDDDRPGRVRVGVLGRERERLLERRGPEPAFGEVGRERGRRVVLLAELDQLHRHLVPLVLRGRDSIEVDAALLDAVEVTARELLTHRITPVNGDGVRPLGHELLETLGHEPPGKNARLCAARPARAQRHEPPIEQVAGVREDEVLAGTPALGRRQFALVARDGAEFPLTTRGLVEGLGDVRGAVRARVPVAQLLDELSHRGGQLDLGVEGALPVHRLPLPGLGPRLDVQLRGQRRAAGEGGEREEHEGQELVGVHCHFSGGISHPRWHCFCRKNRPSFIH